MAKDKKAKAKANDLEKFAQPSEILIEEPKEEPKDIRKIDIVIESLQNVKAVYPISYLYVRSEYDDQIVDESERSLIMNRTVEAENTFSIEIDVLSSKDIDVLASKPVTSYQTFGEPDDDLISQLERSDMLTLGTVRSFDSALSVYEGFTGQVVPDKDDLKRKKARKKGSVANGKTVQKRASETSSKMKGSKRSSMKLKKSDADFNRSKWEKNKDLDDITVVGMCTMDMLPLVLGNETFSVTLDLKPVVNFDDDRMLTYKNLPKMIVHVSIESPIVFPSEPTIMSFTLESILNIPSSTNAQMDYIVCAWVPLSDTIAEKQIFQRSRYKTEEAPYQMKCWPNFPPIGDNINTMAYKINPDLSDVKHSLEGDLSTFVESDNARLTYNYLKRNVLLQNNKVALRDYLSKYRMLLIEVYMADREDICSNVKTTFSQDDTKGRRASKTDSKRALKSTSDGQHLMALVDISSLVYPGVTKLRAACQLSSYHEKEAVEATGIDDSYFVPKVKITIEDPDPKGKGKEKPKKSSGSGSDKASLKSSKSKDSAGSSKRSMKDKLPLPPVPEIPLESSMKIYNDNEDSTVIIIEIELTEPLVPQRPLQEVLQNLTDVVRPKPKLPKVVVNLKVAEEEYNSVIREINQDLINNYGTYLEDKGLCQCREQSEFLSYLRRIGSFQKYAMTLLDVTTQLITRKFNTAEFEQGIAHHTQHLKMMGQLFIYLINQTNSILNKENCTIIAVDGPLCALDDNLLYAREATETKQFSLAEKFYMERLCLQDNDANVWFDYAIFQLEMDSLEIAFEYLNEALSRQIDHSNSLLLYALLLADKKKWRDAETCLMAVLANRPHWAEAWGILFLFFQKNNNSGGMRFAESIAMKYLHDDTTFDDYLMNAEDLIWTPVDCPETLFFRTAMLLLKLRMYFWVEDALAFEIADHPGYVNYLLAAICYYKGDYDHALNHLTQAMSIVGSNYGISALTGHCLLWKGQLAAAKGEYYHVLESYNRPNDMHMLYVNCSRCLGLLGQNEEARQMMLTACKYNATPHAWMTAGIYYYYVSDLLSAEECFTEAILCNDRIPEIWAYLTLVNLELDKEKEYELCYRQALRNDLQNEELLKMIQYEIENYQRRNLNSAASEL